MSSKVVDTLITKLALDGADFVKNLDKTFKEAQTWGDRVTKITKGITIGSIGGTAAFSAGLLALTKSAIDSADAFDEQSQRLNVTAEDLSAYAYQAKFAGVANEELNGALTKFNKSTADAFQGTGKGADAFEALGISVQKADGNLKSNSDLLGEVADKFAQLEDGPIKTALAMDLFGKSAGPKLIPMLNGGTKEMELFRAEAKRLGVLVSNETAAAAGEFNDNLDKLKTSLQGIGLNLATAVLPHLNQFTEDINDPATQQGLVNIAIGITEISSAVVQGIAALSNFTGWVGEQTAAMLNGISADDVVRLEQRRDQILSSMSDSMWERFSKGGNTDFFTSKEELQKQLDQIDLMLADAYKRRELQAQLSNKKIAEANTAGVAPDKPKTRSETLVTSGAAKDGFDWELEQRQEIQAMLDREKKEREAAEKEIEIQRDKFARIHEEALAADKKVVDLESFRYLRQQEELKKELDALKEKGLLTAELELEFQKAREEQEKTHQARLKDIKEKAAADELKRRAIQLQGAESLFSSLGDLTEEFGGKSSRMRKALLVAEKASAIARATIAIQTGIAEAAANPWPMNIAAMASVVGATAGIVSNINSVNIAHGGLTNVPKESTYLLDKGERVVSPKQNRDLTAFLQGAGGGSSMKIEVINNATNQPIAAEASMINEDTLRIVLKAVDRQLRDDLGNGRGVFRQMESRYGLAVKGAY